MLLFDEPLSNLDSELRESLCGEMSRLLRQLGITALYVTDDRREAELLADQIVDLIRGPRRPLSAPLRQPQGKSG